MRANLRLKGIALLLAIGLAGCTTVRNLFDSDRVDRADKAGSVHVAVLAVASWEKVKEDLQPKFELTPAQAYEQAIPATQQLIERALDAVSASLKLSLPTTSVSETRTRTEATGQAATETSSRTEERKPGDASKVQSGQAVPERTVPAPFSAQPALDARALDPLLRYQAATALYQEVKILNQYVASALQRQGYTPYLVRLQVSVLPHRRNLPYDTYANISFYSARERVRRSEPLATLRGGSRLSGPTALFATEGEPDFRGERNSSRTLLMQHPVVVPLLVTDNLESMLHERALQTIRQSAIGLAALLSGLGIGANLDTLQNQLDAVIGKDLNSLLTVARMSDNTVRVRLGAMNQPGSGHAIIPRTHNISLLVLVPTKADHVRVMTHAEFRDTEDGEALASRSSYADLLPQIKKIWDKYRLPELQTDQDYFNIANAVYFNDFLGFTRTLQRLEAGRKQAVQAAGAQAREQVVAPTTSPLSHLNLFTYVWVDLIGTRLGSAFSQASFDVPKAPAQQIATCPAKQTAVLVDDESATSAVLHAGLNLAPAKLSAFLSVTCAGGPYRLAPEQLASADGRTLQLSFSSLKAVLPDECTAAPKPPPDKYKLTVRDCTAEPLFRLVAKLREAMDAALATHLELEDHFQDYLDNAQDLLNQGVTELNLKALKEMTKPSTKAELLQVTLVQEKSDLKADLEVLATALKKAIDGVEKAANAGLKYKPADAPFDQPPAALVSAYQGIDAPRKEAVKSATALSGKLSAFIRDDKERAAVSKALADLAYKMRSLEGAVAQAAPAAVLEPKEYTARYLAKAKPPASPLTLNATHIVPNDSGDGKLAISVGKLPETEVRLLRISGADVSDLDPKLPKNGSGWTLKASTDVTLTLRNLTNQSEVSVWATTDKGATVGKVFELKVIQPPKKESR